MRPRPLAQLTSASCCSEPALALQDAGATRSSASLHWPTQRPATAGGNAHGSEVAVGVAGVARTLTLISAAVWFSGFSGNRRFGRLLLMFRDAGLLLRALRFPLVVQLTVEKRVVSQSGLGWTCHVDRRVSICPRAGFFLGTTITCLLLRAGGELLLSSEFRLRAEKRGQHRTCDHGRTSVTSFDPSCLGYSRGISNACVGGAHAIHLGGHGQRQSRCLCRRAVVYRPQEELSDCIACKPPLGGCAVGPEPKA